MLVLLFHSFAVNVLFLSRLINICIYECRKAKWRKIKRWEEWALCFTTKRHNGHTQSYKRRTPKERGATILKSIKPNQLLYIYYCYW